MVVVLLRRSLQLLHNCLNLLRGITTTEADSSASIGWRHHVASVLHVCGRSVICRTAITSRRHGLIRSCVSEVSEKCVEVDLGCLRTTGSWYTRRDPLICRCCLRGLQRRQ